MLEEIHDNYEKTDRVADMVIYRPSRGRRFAKRPYVANELLRVLSGRGFPAR